MDIGRGFGDEQEPSLPSLGYVGSRWTPVALAKVRAIRGIAANDLTL
jgi:hypothetical protein